MVTGIETPGRFYPDFSDPESLAKDVLEVAEKFVKRYPDIGAFVIECSDFPIASADISKSTDLPVFDYINLVNYIHQTIFPKKHEGFI